MTDFEKLFNPRAIAIVGANEKRFGGGYFLRSMLHLGFERPIYPINPRLQGKILEGYAVYRSLLDTPEESQIDYAIIAVPARYVPQVLEECGKKGIPFATVFTSGFSEVGNYELEKEVLETARRNHIRILGPNCLGIFVPKIKLTISTTLLSPHSGHLGMIFQSGGLAVYVGSMAQSVFGTNPSKVISIGNQIDLNFVDFLEYFLTDEETNLIALYLENIKSIEIGRKFLKIAKKLSLAGKPVILWKVGSGKASQEAIISHTGGLAGSLEIWEAVCKQTGMIQVNNSHELINTAMLFNHLKQMPISRNMSITAVGGGASIETTDVFERNNLNIPKLTEKTANKFRELIPDVNTIIRNPLDLGGSGADPEIFYKTLITLDSDPNVSAVIFIKVYDFNRDFIDTIKRACKDMTKPLIGIAYKVLDDKSDYKGKLQFKEELFALNIPVFESIELAAKALDKMCIYREFLDHHKKEKQDKIKLD